MHPETTTAERAMEVAVAGTSLRRIFSFLEGHAGLRERLGSEGPAWPR